MEIIIKAKAGEGKSTVAVIIGAALMSHGFKPEIFDEVMDESFYTEVQHKRRLETLTKNNPDIKIITQQESLPTSESLKMDKHMVMESLRRIEMASVMNVSAVQDIEMTFAGGLDTDGFPKVIQATIKFRQSEFAWLIETSLNDRPVYFNGNSLDSGLPSYTGNPHEAKKFLTKEAAELELIQNLGLHGEPVEHGFN